MEEIKGTEIVGVNTHYEHIYVSVAPDANGKLTRGFYISPRDLVAILNEFDFLVAKKRTRRWGRVEIDQWIVEKDGEPRT